jgi:hypothetical protein
VLHHLLLAGRSFFGRSFSSLLAYRIGERVRVVGAYAEPRAASGARGAIPGLAEAAGAGTVSFTVATAPLNGGWRAAARLEVGERLPEAEVERLAFTPWHTGGGIRPVGPLMGLRRSAYRGSQRGRGLDPAEVP